LPFHDNELVIHVRWYNNDPWLQSLPLNYISFNFEA
jgi:hypothetical protein